MNQKELKSTIKQIRDSQTRYNQEIGALIGQLEKANLKENEASDSTKPRAISIDDHVTILNPSRFGSKEGTVVRLTRTRVTVNTKKGKVVRAYHNVHIKDTR